MREILRIAQDPVSLEPPVGDEEDFSLSDFIEDQGAVVPADAAARALLTEAVEEALEELTEREQKVVRLRFGLDDGQIRTLEEVGKEFGVTRERIRQIESKTLAKLRHPIRSPEAARLPRRGVTPTAPLRAVGVEPGTVAGLDGPSPLPPAVSSTTSLARSTPRSTTALALSVAIS